MYSIWYAATQRKTYFSCSYNLQKKLYHNARLIIWYILADFGLHETNEFQIMMLTKFFEYQNIEKLDNVDLIISYSHRFHLYTNLQVLFRPFSNSWIVQRRQIGRQTLESNPQLLDLNLSALTIKPLNCVPEVKS